MTRFAALATFITLALILALPAPAAAADDGPALFKTKCGACHGPDGAGQTPMGKKLTLRDLGSAEVQAQSDADLTAIISKGKNKMPTYEGKLTSDQIKALVGFIRTLKK